MISFTLTQLLELAGLSSPHSTPESNITGATKTLLQIPAVRNATITKISRDYSTDKMAKLLFGIPDVAFLAFINNEVTAFLNKIGASTASNKDHPLFTSLEIPETDALTELLRNLAKSTGGKNTVGTTSSRTQFIYNADRYIIYLTSEEESSLDETELLTLGAAKIDPEQIVPQSAVIMTDEKSGEKYRNQKFPTYTGVDMRVIFMTPHVITQSITIKVLSYSMHSGKLPVSTLGRANAKGFAHGDRVIAGSIVATVTVNDPLHDLQPLLYGAKDYAKSVSDIWRTYLLPDQFPPFDVLLLFSNEFGFSSAMSIFGLSLTDMGSAISMSDSEIEVTYTYTALDMDILRGISSSSEDGSVSTFDITSNNEYIARRKMAYDGKSQHRNSFEIGAVYGAIDSRIKEFQYNKLRMAGFGINSIPNISKLER